VRRVGNKERRDVSAGRQALGLRAADHVGVDGLPISDRHAVREDHAAQCGWAFGGNGDLGFSRAEPTKPRLDLGLAEPRAHAIPVGWHRWAQCDVGRAVLQCMALNGGSGGDP
jgi:hypothetical protein